VKRMVHTSSVAAIGPAAPGGRADEQQAFTAGKLGIAYMNSKREAEAEVMRVGARGLDAVVVNPTFVLGPDDRGASSMALVKRYLLRRIPAIVDGGLNVVDVRDVADGHLLADANGAAGERYILGGRNFTLQRLFADFERIGSAGARPQAALAAGDRRRSRRRAVRPASEPRCRRDAFGLALVDLLVGEGEARARLHLATTRGDARGRR
jgi:dihydroflavonol-4-reductase